jgi:hypothetical protein
MAYITYADACQHVGIQNATTYTRTQFTRQYTQVEQTLLYDLCCRII